MCAARLAAKGMTSSGSMASVKRDGRSAAEDSGVRACYWRAKLERGGGFVFSRLVNDRLGTVVAAVALRYRVHPSLLTLGSLVLGIGGSLLVLFGVAAPSPSPAVCVGVGLWQVAYIFDCADGQTARAASATTPAGARLDLLVDFAVQASITVALVRVAEHDSHFPLTLLVAYVALWPVSLLTFMAQKASGGEATSLLSTSSRWTEAARLARDYGLTILVLGVWAAASPATVFVPMCAVLAVNAIVLFGYIGSDALQSLSK